MTNKDTLNAHRLHAVRGVLAQLFVDRNDPERAGTIADVLRLRETAVEDIRKIVATDWLPSYAGADE